MMDTPVGEARAAGTAAPTLLDALRDTLGSEQVLTGDALRARARHIWDPRPLQAAALLRPGTTEDVSTALALCHAARQPVVAQGGLTGLAGGSDSTAADIVLSLERMTEIETPCSADRKITVQAGAVLEHVQRAATESGLQFGLDLGARGSCTIGGNIATNAGGLSVLRYGMMRAQVLGLEAVLADGTVVSSMLGLVKNNTGYDWTQLMIGSEGTLGIVTRAILKLHPPTPVVATAMVGAETLQKIVALLDLVATELDGTLNAFELIWNSFYRLNTDQCHHDHVPAPLDRDHPLYAIVECRGAHASLHERFESVLSSAFDRSLIVDAVVAQSERDRSRIWPVREHIDIALRHDPVFVYDISLPLGAMPAYLDEVEQRLRVEWPAVNVYCYGHLADGNLHLLVAPDALPGSGRVRDGHGDPSTLTLEREARSDAIVYGALRTHGGSVSAEHGIGTKKKRWLSYSRSAAELELMRSLKRALDPVGILNPGKIL